MESAEFMKHTSTNKFELGVNNKETEEPEYIQNIIETVDVVNVSENTGEKQNIDSDNNVKTECVLSEPECEAGKSKQLETFKNKAQDTKPPNKQIKTSKKGKKINLKSEKGFSKSEDQKWPQNQESPAESKMSYSSVIKSNLIKDPKPTPPTTSQPKAEPVPIPSPLPTSSTRQAAKTTTRQDYDKWEKVPPSVSKLQNWEKTSKKRKNKNIRFEDSSLTEDEGIPELEVVFKIEEKTREVLIEEKDRFNKEVNKGLKKELDKVLKKEVNNFSEKRVT